MRCVAPIAAALLSALPVGARAAGVDDLLNDALAPFATWLSSIIFYEVSVGGVSFPWIVAWLIAGALYFTIYFRGINLRGMGEALALL
ncbi:MAG: alanine glycine permease, partial [Myxococcota bacterium]